MTGRQFTPRPLTRSTETWRDLPRPWVLPLLQCGSVVPQLETPVLDVFTESGTVWRLLSRARAQQWDVV